MTEIDKKKTLSYFKKPSISAISDNQKNCIIVIIESFESWAINATFDDITITPNINALINDSASQFFPFTKVLTKDGRSSDAQLMINTGLLPIKTGPSCFKYGTNEYPSLPQYFKKIGYQNHILIGGEKTFWNHETFAKTQGFDNIYTKEDFETEGYMCGFLGISDSAFFKQSLVKLKSFTQPFYSELISLSSHDPFSLPEGYTKTNFDCNDEYICNYITSLSYVDNVIGQFIKDLKENNLYQNSKIIITGDHEGVGPKRNDFFTKYKDRIIAPFNSYPFIVPYIVLNSKEPKIDTTLIGQIDIYPSIIDEFNISNNEWKGFGHSVYDTTERIDNINELYNLSDAIIQTNFFNTKEFKSLLSSHPPSQ